MWIKYLNIVCVIVLDLFDCYYVVSRYEEKNKDGTPAIPSGRRKHKKDRSLQPLLQSWWSDEVSLYCLLVFSIRLL